MRDRYDNVINLRLPADLRIALVDEARAHGVKLSTATRKALIAGLQAIRAGGTLSRSDQPASCRRSQRGEAA